MKKISLILLSSFYLIASSGMMVCGHNTKNLFNSLFIENPLLKSKELKSCCLAHTKSLKKIVSPQHKSDCPKGCCSDGVCSVKAKGEPNSYVSFQIKSFKNIIDKVGYGYYSLQEIASVNLTLPTYHSPPLNNKYSLFVKYQVFRI